MSVVKTELDVVDFDTAFSLVKVAFFENAKKWFVIDYDDEPKFKLVNKSEMRFRAYFEQRAYPAPELELVSKWLMENQDINITVCLQRKEFCSVWYFNIDHIKVDKILHRWHPTDPTYSTYEQALLEAIKMSIKFCKNTETDDEIDNLR